MLIEQTIQDQLSPAFLETGARPFPRRKKAGSWGRAQETLPPLVNLPGESTTENLCGDMVGPSWAMQKVFDMLRQVAHTEATVLITGETGTGKELVARALHNLSARSMQPLVTVNCAALPAGLIESELFGHEKGAFTGAVNRKIWRFELAHGGTIFLDEIGELPRELQPKLLRFLQEQEFERVGGSQTIRVDARVIAATNCDLRTATQAGQFRPDLYYRLNVFPIPLPPLRERQEDILPLVQHFVKKCATKMGKRIIDIEPAALPRLLAYTWPGNIGELEHVIERAIILAKGPVLEMGAAVLPVCPSPHHDATHHDADHLLTLKEVERRHIVHILEKTHGVVEGPRGAAQVLDLHPNTLRGRMRKLGIGDTPSIVRSSRSTRSYATQFSLHWIVSRATLRQSGSIRF